MVEEEQIWQKPFEATETEWVKENSSGETERDDEREGGKWDKEDFVESQEVEGRAWWERGRKGWEEVEESE